jgi:hypothetical protein
MPFGTHAVITKIRTRSPDGFIEVEGFVDLIQ